MTKLTSSTSDLIKSHYYPVFRKFILNNCPEDYCEISSSVTYSITIEDNKAYLKPVSVENVLLSFFDDEIGLGIYSFSLRVDAPISFANFIKLLGQFRNFNTEIRMGKQKSSLLEFIEFNILRCEDNPNTQIKIKINKESEACDYSGAKLKSFVAIELNSLDANYSMDEALYELGTFTDYSTSKKMISFHSPSSNHFDFIVSKKISVFRNWSALALFDSFVIIGKTGYLAKEETISTISGSYFKIFLFNLYSKFYLFKTNSDLETKKRSTSTQRLYSFLKKYDISHVSYNFLPNLLHTKIKEALEITSELKSVKSKIELIDSQNKEKNTNWINALLFFIGSLSIISVLADFPRVFKTIFDSNNDKQATYIAGGVVIVVLAVLFVRFKWYQKKWH